MSQFRAAGVLRRQSSRLALLIGLAGFASPLQAQVAPGGPQTPSAPIAAPAEPPPIPDAFAPGDTTDPATVRPVPQVEVETLQDIVVTAQRREEALQRVPVAVTAITGRELETNRIVRYDQLNATVPNLSVQRGATPNDTSISIRGISPTALQLGQDGSVGFYIDGVYVPSRAASNLDIFEIERLEVLRGPQGTLFGRNSSAGAISVITRGPTRDFRASVSADVGDYESYRFTATAGGPLPVENFFYRVGGYASGNEGYQVNTTTGQRLQSEQAHGGTFYLGYASDGPVQVKLTADYASEENDSGSFDFLKRSQVAFGPSGPSVTTTYPDIFDREVQLNTEPSNTRDVWGLALTVDADIGGAILTSISAYRSSEIYYIDDVDYTAVGTDDSYSDISSGQWSQELRISSSNPGPITWLGGLYFSHETIDSIVDLTISFPTGTFTTRTDYDQTSTTSAVFGQVNITPIENLTLSLGSRLSYDQIEVVNQAIGGIPGLINAGTDVYPEYEEEAFTYKASLDYRFTPAIMAYASLATGFRPGGCNSGALPDGVSRCYEREESTSYEIGLKTTLFDNRVRFNLAAFYMDYAGLQLRVNDFITGSNYTANYDAKTQGLEAELTWLPFRGLLLSSSLGITDAEFNEQFVLPNAPEMTASFRGELTRPLNDKLDLLSSVRVSHTGRTNLAIVETPELDRDPYTTVDLDMGVGGDRGRWRLTAYVQNLFEEDYFTAGRESAGASGMIDILAIPGAPRTGGVRASYRF